MRLTLWSGPLLVWACLAHPVAAQQRNTSTCAAIKDLTRRLECYHGSSDNSLHQADEPSADIPDEQARREHARARFTRDRQALRDAVGVVVGGKRSTTRDDRDSIELSFVYENRTDRDIRGFKGTVLFTAESGDLLKKVSLEEEDGLKAKQIMSVTRQVAYNRGVEAERRFLGTDLKQMQIEWKPELILFTDGTSLASPQ